MRKLLIIPILLILLSAVIGIYLYPSMPEKMAGHWNAQGNVDGHISKFWGLFLTPIIMLACFLLFIYLPKLDPMKKNIESFRNYFDLFIVVIMLFFFYLHILTLAWNLGYTFNMTLFLIPGFAIVFFVGGMLVSNAKQNWFIGIRTPWTLSNKEVWDKTHKLGGKLFKIAAIISLLGLLFPKYAIWIMIVPIIGSVIYTLVYSYVEFRNLTSLRNT